MRSWPHMLAVLAGLVIAMLPGATTLRAETRYPAGYVTAVTAPEVDGKPAVSLRRDGEELEAQIWTPLFAGDVIEVRGGGSATIETARDKRLVVTAANSPHRIEGALAGSKESSEIASLIGDLFRRKPPKETMNLIGRSDEPPSLRIGGGRTQLVTVGTSLWLRWRGGTPPYTIEIRGQSAKRNHDVIALAQVTSDAAQARITIPDTAAGQLALVIRDSKGLETTQRLETVTSVGFPDWFIGSAPTAEYSRVEQALYLLRQPGQSYDLMAAAIAAEARDYPPAETLLRMMADGWRPKQQ